MSSEGSKLQRLASRRTYLKTVAAGSVMAAGCIGGSGDDTDNGEPTDGNGVTVGNGNGAGELAGRTIHLVTQEDSPDYLDYWRRLSEGFHEETGANLNVETIPDGVGGRERVVQLMQAGNPPEIAEIDINQLATFMGDDIIADHSEVVDEFESLYGTIPEEYLVKDEDGRDLFWPIKATTSRVWYRDDVLTDVPNTWDKVIEQAAEHDDPDGTRGYAMVNSRSIVFPHITVMANAWGNEAFMMQRNDAGELEVVMDQEPYLSRWIELMEYYDELAAYSHPGRGHDYGGVFATISSELGNMVEVAGNRPKLMMEADNLAYTHPAHTPVPDGKEPRLWGDVKGYLTLEGADNEAAIEFIKYWLRPENLTEFYRIPAYHHTPVVTSIAETDEFQQQVQTLPDKWDAEKDVMEPVRWAEEGWLMDIAQETDPLNPHAAPLYNSLAAGNAQVDVVIDGKEPAQAILDNAAALRDELDR